MSQLSIKSFESASPTALNPVLQGVLSYLDINLEEELSQYRRHRRKETVSNTKLSGDKQVHKPVELISIQSSVAASSASASGTTTVLQKPTSIETSNPLGISEAIPGTLITLTNGSTPTTPLESVTLSAETLTTQPREPIPPTPDHYLQSSEELLKSLDEPQEPERSWTDYLFTPLGIGSMLLFLLSCATLGYVVTNTNQEPITVASNVVVASKSNPEALPKAPNLVAQEFVTLDLDTLSKVDPQPHLIPSPSASVQPTLPPQPKAVIPPAISVQTNSQSGFKNLSDTLIPKPAPSARPVVVAPQPSPNTPATPRTPTPNTATRPVPSQDGFYYVVINYTGEASLAEAQKVVPDAYILESKEGTKIAMGTLGDAAAATQLAQELQAAGFAPQYHKF